MSVLNESAGMTVRLNDFYHIRYHSNGSDVVRRCYMHLKSFTYPINKEPNLHDIAGWTGHILQIFDRHYTMRYTFIRPFVLEMEFYAAGIKMGTIILQAKNRR